MDNKFSLQDSTIAIVGLGLMGGSLALALKDHCRAVIGSDTDPATVEAACRQEVVSIADTDPARILVNADLVILAAPVPAIIDLLDMLPTIMPNPCIIMDIGSAKRSIVSAMRRLPERFEPVGGHPLCGKETLSLSNADAALYQSAPFVVTPLDRTTTRALSAISQVIEAIGAKRVIANPEEHDRFLASTSHLPFLLSSALALAVPEECAPFVGPGFRSTSRLAGTPSSMMLGVLRSNRDNVLDGLRRVQEQLAEFEVELEREDFPKLEIRLSEARRMHGILTQ